MIENVKAYLATTICDILFHALQLLESTDISSIFKILKFVINECSGRVNEGLFGNNCRLQEH
jgi:hypothetical protein